MPMILILETDGGASEFAVKLIDRKTRQSMTKKLAVDSQGRECSRATLTRDGLALRSGAVADSYEDEDGNSIDRGEVIQTDESGNLLRNLSATIGRPQRPVGPIPVEELLEHTTIKAYALVPMVTANDLRDSLTGGDIYRVALRSRASVVDSPAFILANASGVFLLQCKTCLIEFIRLDQPIVLEDDIGDEDDLWDDWQMSAGVDTDGRPVRSVRRIRAASETHADALFGRYPDPDELSRALISGDPEIDLEMTARATGSCDRVHLDGDGQILYSPSVIEVRYGSDGIECERRPLSVRPSNLVTPVTPIWSGLLLPRDNVIRRYALTRAYQVMHSNALEFDFLYGISAHLDERQAMARIGSGRRGIGSLMLERNGLKYGGFLDGRIQGDSMRLVLYLAAFELAVTEER